MQARKTKSLVFALGIISGVSNLREEFFTQVIDLKQGVNA
jgi:hypothetical protein